MCGLPYGQGFLQWYQQLANVAGPEGGQQNARRTTLPIWDGTAREPHLVRGYRHSRCRRSGVVTKANVHHKPAPCVTTRMTKHRHYYVPADQQRESPRNGQYEPSSRRIYRQRRRPGAICITCHNSRNGEPVAVGATDAA